MELAPGVVIAGKYQLEWPLARGGMGSLWQARHAQLKVPLAIKFMEPAYAASAVGRQRFEREATSAAQLRHPNVVHVQDYGVEGGLPYIVMELLVGEDLGKRLKRFRRLPVPAVAAILTQVSKALRRAHEGGFIHRDLKPSNIFLTRGDDDEEIVKILDFGIAKQLMQPLSSDGEATKTGEIIGSPSYMSPEQIRGARDIDGRADLWSLGVILFRCLTGRLPFDGDTTPDIIANILTAQMPVATNIVPDLPRALNVFFERALARDREQRFQSVRELTEAFAGVTRMPLPSIANIDMGAGSGIYGPPDANLAASGFGTATPIPGSYAHAATPPSFPSAGLGAPYTPAPPGASAPFASQPPPSDHSRAPSSAAFPAFPPFPPPPQALTQAGSTSQAGIDFNETLRRDQKLPMPGLGGESPTHAPSAGTLTVSPSITGGEFYQHFPQRKALGWWIVGAGMVIGVVGGVGLVLAGRNSASDPGQEESGAATTAQSASPAVAPPSAPSPAVSAAPPADVAAPAPSSSAAAAATQTTASPKSSAKVKSGTAPRPPTGPTTTTPPKKKDWGI